MRHVLPFVSLLALSAPAHAQSVDTQGAGRLLENLSRYFGSTVFDTGILKVTADGDAYRLDFDADAVLALVPAEDKASLKMDIDPYALRLKPGVGDTWDVSGPLMPNADITFAGPQGEQTMSWTVADGSFTGVYDPKLANFATATASHGKIRMLSGDPTQTAEITVASGALQIESVSAAGGGVDVDMTQTVNAFSETMNVHVPDGARFTATITSPKVTITSKATGARSRQMLDLLAFGVANADEAKIKANQAELKSRVLAVLPLWNEMDGSYAFDSLTVATPVGAFGASTFGIFMDSDGISTDGSVNYGFRAGGLTVPPGIIPAWAAPLLPTDFEIVMGGARLDSDTAVRTAVAAFDLAQDPPISDAVGQKIAADFLAKNPTFTVGRSFVRTADSEIAFDGAFTYVDQKPAFQATIDAKGFDRIVAVMQDAAATSPEASQVFPFVLAAKGLGKPMPDGSLQWLMDVRPDGSIRVNGAMVKPADAPAEVTP